MCKVIAVAMQKGGCAKTSVSLNLGIGLARAGKKVLLIDNDPQGNLTASLGYEEPDDMSDTLASVMMKIINEEPIEPGYGILHHQEGLDLMPGNIELSGLEVLLANVMSRENILKEYIDQIKDQYGYIIIDCMPSLGMTTINALVAATSVLIPVPAAYLPVKGLCQLIKTISMVKKRLNKKLKIEGIVLTMVDYRTNYAKDITQKLREGYESTIGVFNTYIPFSVKAAECSLEGVSIYIHEPKGKVAEAYKKLTEEVLSHENQNWIEIEINNCRKNKWIDNENRVYVVYPISEMQEDLNVSKKKAIEYLKELETVGLVKKKVKGFGLPNHLYVKNFVVSQPA